MPKTKKTPNLRFPEFTADWEQRKLGDLADIVRGASPRPIQDPKWFDAYSEIGWLRISDVTAQNGRIHNLEQRISLLAQEKTRVLLEPHLLLSIAATVGKPVVNYVKTGVHDGFLIFMNPKFYQEFLFQWLEMFRPQWQKYGQPGSQVNLNSSLVQEQGIFIPSLEEQARIGDFFKEFDNLIAIHQRKLEALQEQKKGLLQQMFPKDRANIPELRFPEFTDVWEQRKLGEISKINGRIGFRGYTQNDIVSEKLGALSLSPSNIIDYSLFLNKKNTYISMEKYEESPEIKIYNQDIIFVKTGSTTGKVALIENLNERATLNPQLVVLKEIKVNPKMLSILMSSKQFQKQVEGSKGGGVVPTLTQKELSNYIIKIPSLTEEQDRIGAFFQEFDNLIAIHQRKLEALQEQKKGLLQQMFV